MKLYKKEKDYGVAMQLIHQLQEDLAAKSVEKKAETEVLKQTIHGLLNQNNGLEYELRNKNETIETLNDKIGKQVKSTYYTRLNFFYSLIRNAIGISYFFQR